MLLHWLKAWFWLEQSIFGSGIHGAHSTSSDQPYGRRPGRKLRADSARRAPGAGPGRQTDGDVGDVAPVKPEGISELLYQIRLFHGFLWASGGVFSDYYIHQIDELSGM